MTERIITAFKDKTFFVKIFEMNYFSFGAKEK